MDGYYSIVQFVPDLARAEALNIGVLVNCPHAQDYRLELTNDFTKAKSAFRLDTSDIAELRAMKESFRRRIKSESETLRTWGGIETLASEMVGHVMLTKPQWMQVSNLANDSTALFHQLVGEPRTRTTGSTAYAKLKKHLDLFFSDAKYADIVEKDIEIEVPGINRSIEAEYGFKNGKYHFVMPQRLGQHHERILSEALRLAGEIGVVRKHGYDNLDAEFEIVLPNPDSKADEDLLKKMGMVFDDNGMIVINQDNADKDFAQLLSVAHP